MPEGHRWSLPLGQPGLLSGTTGHPPPISFTPAHVSALRKEGVRLSFNKVTFSKLLLSEASGLQLHSVEAFELESAGTKRYSQRRRRGRSGGFCDPPLLFLFSLHSCTSRCTLEANARCGGTLGGFCFSFFFTCKTATTRQSKTVLNSHQKSECVCSLVTFSLLFVCLCACVSLCPSCVSMASPSAGRSHSTPASCRPPPPLPPPPTRDACLR